jgi:predicted Ser/Thr protein kinase
MRGPTDTPSDETGLGEQLRNLAPDQPAGLAHEVGLQLLLSTLEMAEPHTIRIGRFVVREKLGQGGMGTVYRAFDPRLERDVALKVIEGSLSEADADAVRHEARALARLAHPHVVSVYELGIEDGQVFVAMEYVAGANLREHVESLEDSDPQGLIGLFLQAGLGLVAAHEAGLIHRDIKPENLLVGKDGRVLLADFGLACMAETPRQREVAGTPRYMAPEVVASGEASVFSDQFAFCASLWMLLDPQAALGGPTDHIPPAIRGALARGLETHPADRWPSMSALLTAVSDGVDRGPDAHHRSILLQRVHTLWIRGVLEASLADGPVLKLPLSGADEQVDAPWRRPSGDSADPVLGTLRGVLEEGQGSLLLLGEPGAGKTTLLLQLAEAMLTEAHVDRFAPVPVVLLLASLATHSGDIDSWIEQELVAKYGVPRRNVRRWIEAGSIAMLFDGLDEVSLRHRVRCVERLNAFRTANGLPMVVACRTSEYTHLGLKLGFGRAVCVDPVPLEVVAGLPHLGEAADATLRTPLMLALLARCEGELPNAGARLPWLYDRYVDHTFEAGNVAPERRTELIAGLRVLAQAMARNDRSALWLEQLGPDWLFDDGRSWVTKALGVTLLTVCVVGLNVMVGVLAEGDPVSGLLFGLCSVPTILVLNGGLTIHPVERLRFSWRRLVRLAPVTVSLGLAAGAIYGMFYVLWVNVVFGVVAALVILVILSFEPSFQETGVRPNQGIRQSFINGVTIGALGLVLGGFTLGYVAVPLVLPYLSAPSTLVGIPHPERSSAAVAGMLIGVISGMVRGGWAVIMHAAVRLVLAATTPLPLRLASFLDQAAELALMRRVGGGYLFLHRTFQDYLADDGSS